MNEQTFNEMSKAAETAYSQQPGVGDQQSGEAIDIFSIILTIITALIGACPKPPSATEFKSKAASPSRYDDVMLDMATRRVMREQYGWLGYRRHNGDAIKGTVKELGRTQSVDKIQAVINACG